MYKLQPTMCCGDTTKLQHDYYTNQAGQGLTHFSGAASQYGHGLPYYSGGEYQRGHGLGTLMSGAIKQFMPMLQPHLSKVTRGVKRKLAEVGFGVVKDVISGKRLKTAIKDRTLETIGINQHKPRKGPIKRPAKRPIKRPSSRKPVISTPARGRATSDRFKNTVFR